MASPGPEVDRAILEQFFSGNGNVLPYSTDAGSADMVRSRLKAMYKCPVLIGETRTRPKKYFARFDSGPSTATEVLAETQALAICRLALLIGMKRESGI
jgi:hypothetical protein